MLTNWYINIKDFWNGIYNDVEKIDMFLFKFFKVVDVIACVDFGNHSSTQADYSILKVTDRDVELNDNHRNDTLTPTQLEKIESIKKANKDSDVKVVVSKISLNDNHKQTDATDKVGSIMANLIENRKKLFGIKDKIRNEDGKWTKEGLTIFRSLGFEVAKDRKTFVATKSKNGEKFTRLAESMKTSLDGLFTPIERSSVHIDTKKVFKCVKHGNQSCEKLEFSLKLGGDVVEVSTIDAYIEKMQAANVELVCGGTYNDLDEGELK